MSCTVPGCEQATIAECPLLQFPQNEALRSRWNAAISAGTGCADLDGSESGICSWHFGNAPLEAYREPRWFIDQYGEEVEIACCRFCLQFKNRTEMTCYENKIRTQSISNFLKKSLKVTLLMDANFTDICLECLVRVDLLKSWITAIQQVEAEFRSMLVACTHESIAPFEPIVKLEDADESVMDTDFDVELIFESAESNLELEDPSEESVETKDMILEVNQSVDQPSPNKPRERSRKLSEASAIPRKRGRVPTVPEKPKSKLSYKDIQPRKCFICNTLLEDASALLCHLTAEHATKIDYRCVECDKSFPLLTSYNYHLGFHDLEYRPLKCNFCPLGFRTQDSLLNHEIREHNANHQKKIAKRVARVHQCDTCGKTFKRSYKLIEHDNYYHKNLGPECKICSKIFASKTHLKKHQLVHSREKPYKCDQCGHAFSKSEILRKHKMKHQDNYAEWKAQQKKPPPRQRYRQRMPKVREEETG